MKKIMENNGITLVALVVTIIILLIFSGVGIASLSGDSGILSRAAEAKKSTIIAKVIEDVDRDVVEKVLSKKGKGVISENEFVEILSKYGSIDQTEKQVLNFRNLITIEGKYKILINDIIKRIGTYIDIIDRSGANVPIIPEGANVEYVTWENSGLGEPICSKTRPKNWYNYSLGKWANIKTVSNGLEAYWVWVPRFKYTEPMSDKATKIQVEFVNGKEKAIDVHPAFSFGEDELEGFWVAKFEASSNTNNPDMNYGGGNDDTLSVQSKPGVQSWRLIDTDKIFRVCRNMQSTKGVLSGSVNVDSHMMKNTEWGAIAILSQSIFGVFNPNSSNDGQIWNNPNGYGDGKYAYTGYTGDSVDASNNYGSTNKYDKINKYNTYNGTKGSTTGTIYGIYDMAGGAWEYVAGCLKNQRSTNFERYYGPIADKYLNVYTNGSNGNYNESIDEIKGDAVEETRYWNKDFDVFPTAELPVFARGGNYGDYEGTGIFYFYKIHGGGHPFGTFRPVLATGIN